MTRLVRILGRYDADVNMDLDFFYDFYEDVDSSESEKGNNSLGINFYQPLTKALIKR